MKHMFMLFVTIASFGLNAADVPIIFVHGHKSEARPEDPDNKEKGGWKTWYPTESDGITLKYPTAMTKIADAHYGGYNYGLKADGSPAITCDKTTQLQSMPDTRRIYNFSYYRPDGGRGVIGSNGKLECQFIIRVDGAVGRKG